MMWSDLQVFAENRVVNGGQAMFMTGPELPRPATAPGNLPTYVKISLNLSNRLKDRLGDADDKTG